MRWPTCMFLLISVQAFGADFRVLDFGRSCTSVREREEGLGSKQIAWNPSGAEFLAFEAQEFDRQVSILYFCPKGSLFTGNYFFPLEDLDAALRSLRAVYDNLNSLHGRPFLDSTPWEKYADPRFVMADPRKYTVTWRASRIRTTISLAPGHDRSDSTWQVFVVLGRNKE